jgi:hypothetical protein
MSGAAKLLRPKRAEKVAFVEIIFKWKQIPYKKGAQFLPGAVF